MTVTRWIGWGLWIGISILNSGCGTSGPSKPNVIVITMDTTRADHLGCYGYQQIRTPNIDGLASEGVLFEEAFSVQPVTLPSHCSIMTGRYPFHHGVRDNTIYKLPEGESTLAETLSDEGYLTTSFIGSYILSHEFGLDQGFHFYNDEFMKPKQKGQLPVDRRASEISFLADEWMTAVADEIAQRPFFLWLHYYDPHADYDPPHPYRTAYSNPYDGEIAYLDDWLGFLFNRLKSRGLWDNTIVVLTADHGESLGEYNEMTHGMFIYRPTTHVPLIIRYPNECGGKRVKDRVSSVDIVPTVLGFLGIHHDRAFDGIDLNPVIRSSVSAPSRAIYSEVFIPRGFNWSELKGIRRDSAFYIQAPKPELYEIAPGRSEGENRYAEDRVTADGLGNELKAMMRAERTTESEHVAVNDEMAVKLQALGYLVGDSGDPETLSSGTILPDPKDMIEPFNIYQLAQSMLARGDLDDAVGLLEKVLEKDPDNPKFRVDLGKTCMELLRWDNAKEHLMRAIEIDEKNIHAHYLLGVCLINQAAVDEALNEFNRVIALEPNHYLAHFQIGMLRIQASEWDDAIRSFTECLRVRPDDAHALNNMGYIEIKGRNHSAEGIELLRKAVRTSPNNVDLLLSLGNALKQQGELAEAEKHLKHALEIIPDRADLIEELRSIRDLIAVGDS